VLFLEGRYEALARDARREMESASASLDFERAAILRDRLVAIERTLERQEVHAYKGDDFDVLAAAISENDAVVQVFRVRDGTVVGRDHFALEGSEGAKPPEVVESFLRQHHGAAGALPPEIVTPEPIGDAESLERFLSERRAGPVRLHVPQRGRKRRLAELAVRNAADALEQERVRWLADRGKTETALRELQEALGLEGPPKRIECYDVSHVQGTSVVSSMVVFEDGRPAKSQYRRFRARVTDRNDDFANMRETLRRRFARSSQADETAGTAWTLPDLIILDGGKGQLSAGLSALADAGRLQIPIVALAKEREELFLPSRAEPVVLPRTSQGLYLVQRVRDEAHRFAVTYHQTVRSKRAVRSLLDEVPGVGPARKRALLRRFGSVRGMREAPVDDLAAVAGVGPALAKRIKEALDT
jgi:excinuclease ABC subunit C